jgi:hypothetical protein
MMRREEINAVRIVIKINEKSGKGKPKKRWLDTIENDMRAVDVCVGDVENLDKWRIRTRMSTPNSWEKGEGKEETP